MRIIGAPGHYRPGADTNHFLGHCDECDARYLARMSLEEVQDWGPFSGTPGKAGTVRQALYEAYCHVWATSAVRFGTTYGYEVPPTDPEVIELVAALREAVANWSTDQRQAGKTAMVPPPARLARAGNADRFARPGSGGAWS